MNNNKNKKRDRILNQLNWLASKISRLSSYSSLGPDNRNMNISLEVCNEGVHLRK